MADADTERTVVKTHVPAYQKAEWKRHADELGMSQSEFVRTMVQAGRRGFDGDRPSTDRDDGASRADESGDEGLAEQVVAVLGDGDYYDWDELLAALTDDIEDRLEDALQDLQAADRVRYSGRHGGYALSEP
ncbi:MAG: DUF5805 domain-containing protein [Haloarculaceae archaeon]